MNMGLDLVNGHCTPGREYRQAPPTKTTKMKLSGPHGRSSEEISITTGTEKIVTRDAVARGIYLAYTDITQHISAVRYTTPKPTQNLENLAGTKLASLAEIDPTRVLYNALVPFAIASLEGFFSRCFKILLRYQPGAEEKILKQTKKVELKDVIAIKKGTRTIEDIVADWYSFQNIDSIHRAFSEWFVIDFWSIVRKPKNSGNKIQLLENQLNYIIDFRHGIVHRMEVNCQLTKPQVDDIFATILSVIDTFVEHLEKTRGTPIRDTDS